MSLLHGVRTVLLVHAHPDDETLASGALILELVARGIRVVLLTATRGERGEIVPAVRHRIPAGEVALTDERERELATAVAALGIAESHLLGTPPARATWMPLRRYRDSGMRWLRPGLAGPVDDIPIDALCAAELTEVTADVATLIDIVQPDLVIGYDDNGGYGHPDHRRIREAALGAATNAGVAFAELHDAPGAGVEWFDLRHRLPGVQRALRAHASQLTVDGDHVVHSGGQREPLTTSVGLRLVTR